MCSPMPNGMVFKTRKEVNVFGEGRGGEVVHFGRSS